MRRAWTAPLQPLMMARTTALTTALMVSSCGPKTPPAPPVPTVDAEAAVAAFRDQAAPATLRARLKLRVDGPEQGGSTGAVLALERPDRLRLDVLTPLGTPLAVLATDGVALHAWVQRKGTFYRGDEAMAVLTELSGGAVGVGDLLDLLTGKLPLEDADVLDARAAPGGVLVTLGKPAVPDVRVQALLDPQGERLLSLSVAPAPLGPDPSALGAPVFSITYGDPVETEMGPLPGEMVVELPTLGWTVELSARSWEDPGSNPDLFVLEPPTGVQQEDLVEALQKLAPPPQ